MLDKSKNKTVFTNYERKESEIANELLAKMNALIEENKVYDVQILTSNGYSFKNGQGSTTLTARVMDGPRDVTNEFSLTWFKNSTEYSHDASINVQAGSIDELATYLIIAEKDGRERGRNELTVFNVKDGQPGKTPVVHLAWADSADGSVGFSLELPTTKIPKYRGYYVDYSTVASTNPKLYKWERNPDDAAKVADEAKDKADAADSKADSAIDTANSAKDTADEASKQTALVNGLANAAKELADKAKADAAEANRLLGLANTEISKLNTNVNNVKSDLASAETDLNSKIETVKTTLTQNYATKTNLSETKITLNKTISESVASVKQEMSETYAVKSDLTTLQGEYNSFKEDTAQKFSQQVSSIQTIQTDTTEAQKLANDALSKAQNAVASATNASSTASSALDKASDASSVANSASQNATNAVASANSAVSTANAAKSNADKAIADVAALTKTVTSQSTRIDQTSNRIDLVANGITEVGNKLENLKVGGENLFLDAAFRNETVMPDSTSSYIPGHWVRYNNGDYDFGAYNNQINYVQFTSVVNFNRGISQFLDTEAFHPGKEYCIRVFTMCESSNFTLMINLAKKSSSGTVSWYHSRLFSGTIKAGSDYTETRVKFTIPDSDDGAIYGITIVNHGDSTSDGQIIKMVKPKLEEGNTFTDFSISTKDMATQNDLTNNYYQKTTVDSKLSTTVNGITAQYTQDINTKLGNYYDKSTIDSKLTIDGKGIATYVKSTQSQLDNLQIGGRNLLKDTANFGNSGRPNGSKDGWLDSWHSIIESEKYNGLKVRSLKNVSTPKEMCNYYFTGFNLGDTYTLSFWAKGTINTFRCYFYGDSGYVGAKAINASIPYSSTGNFGDGKCSFDNPQITNWTRISITWQLDSTGDINVAKRVLIRTDGATGGDLYVCGVKLEKGNKATDWSPAPEDMATLTQYTEVKQLADRISSTVYDSSTGLTTKVNQLANKYAITALNSAGDILASLNLNANTSTAEINAKLIRLNGSTKMDDAFVNKLVANSILTNKIKATEISGDIIKGGTIQGVTLKSTGSGAEPGEVEVNDGTIAMEKQEVGPSGRYFNRGFVSPLEMTMSKVGPVGGKVGLIRATSFTPFGLYNQALDTGNNVQNHRLFFHYQGLSIESDGANSEVGRNSGLKIFGDNAYIDLKSGILNDPGNDSDPIKMRIIATPNNTFEFRNNYGNIYMFTKNGENPMANGYKIPYTLVDSNMGIRVARIANPNSSGTYLELSNMAGKAWGINAWASDQRLKSNIQSPTQDALATINQLKVRQFDWKSDNVHEDFGLVAQEVEQVLPNAVFKVGDYYQIKDSGLIPVLIGAVQKLSNKVNLLENIIYNTKGSNLL
ncbi:tail fiber domain-containing protein [Enterococcus cecorum]|uniref:tail fiber domain-containing protein n=1 Tax=Enterococcus cecorum TaxID=44008 RepID=UPI00249204C3|nr:tail fiber domain-containing protein [Enterococcus cecorum]